MYHISFPIKRENTLSWSLKTDWRNSESNDTDNNVPKKSYSISVCKKSHIVCVIFLMYFRDNLTL